MTYKTFLPVRCLTASVLAQAGTQTGGLLVSFFVLLPLLTVQAQTTSGRIAVSGKAPTLGGTCADVQYVKGRT